ncbi:DUF4145 domain-containing protein [Halotia wernerae UHCC 0503]|nr:DUF4145 domain-containing protein [Halotia wernerae UHCC 0503]
MLKKIASYKEEISDDDHYQTTSYGNELLRTFQEYMFLKCPQCSNPFVISFIYDNEYRNESVILYPKHNKLINSEIPISIKNAFDEALRCFENGIFTACVIMCRKTIEGICKEHNVENKNLKAQLIVMKEQGLIDQNLFDWADMLRLYGNDAAHDLDVTFCSEDAQDVIDFTYVIIEYVFTYRKKFELLRERNNNIDKNRK